MLDLKHAGIVASQRGAEGGYWLARGSAEVTLAAIIRGVEGPARLPTSQAERPTGTSRVAGWWQQI